MKRWLLSHYCPSGRGLHLICPDHDFSYSSVLRDAYRLLGAGADVTLFVLFFIGGGIVMGCSHLAIALLVMFFGRDWGSHSMAAWVAVG